MSKISIRKKIGKTTFNFLVNKENFKEAYAEAAFYATTPDECSLCKGEDVTLDSNRTQEGHLYVKIKCLNEACNAQATLGSFKEREGGWWKAFEIYEPKGDSSKTATEAITDGKSETATKAKKNDEEEEDDGFPF